ncbi:MAG TPA: PEP-CTERM sorting domain-containing protein [Parvularculaceae bacterium]|nr:PEP-CTERM sorting domain-containing protein [Parvularculaceae bacterium]HNS85808.1 PEP-CTERM sorting domain-containing protein [Parvularculaceae bacterium]
MRALIGILAWVMAATGAAEAATTVYGSSVYQTSGTVIAPNNALGAPDSISSTLLRVLGPPSTLTLVMSQATSGVTTTIFGQRLTAGSNVQIAVGEVVGGTAVFSVFTALPGGFGPSYVLDMSGACALISATGCSLLRIRVSGGPGSGFLLDGVSGVAAAPEPSIWGLMLLGFGATTWRLKNGRKVVVRALA